MNIDSTREYCMSLPHATENVQWGADLCFKIAGKLFAVMALEPSDHLLSFKCTPEKFVELQEKDGIVPAPYMARAQWVSLQRWEVLRDDELRELLRTSHQLVFGKLTRKQQEMLQAGKKVIATRPKQKKKTAAILKKAIQNKAPKKKTAAASKKRARR